MTDEAGTGARPPYGTQEWLERAIADAEPGDVIDLEGRTVRITRPPVMLPDKKITITNGTFVS